YACNLPYFRFVLNSTVNGIAVNEIWSRYEPVLKHNNPFDPAGPLAGIFSGNRPTKSVAGTTDF
ncbi:MAG TPA: hypothetical protein VKE92_00720, partial [Anaerolineales bacterium]|nr:hypothetical protein [Anaerolineales bacterium]